MRKCKPHAKHFHKNVVLVPELPVFFLCRVKADMFSGPGVPTAVAYPHIKSSIG